MVNQNFQSAETGVGTEKIGCTDNFVFSSRKKYYTNSPDRKKIESVPTTTKKFGVRIKTDLYDYYKSKGIKLGRLINILLAKHKDQSQPEPTPVWIQELIKYLDERYK